MNIKCPKCGEVITIEVNKIKLEATVERSEDANRDRFGYRKLDSGEKQNKARN
jgi:sarcosine oxidase delta subunit